MCDVTQNYSFTLIDMPCKIRALVIQYKDWYYILCNSKMLRNYQVKAYIHEMLHIKLKHFDNYDVNLRIQNELEVEKFINKLEEFLE